MHNRCVAVLGRPDSPTDAVEEYCRYLSSALAKREISLELVRVRWAEDGWRSSIEELLQKFGSSKDCWFLLQYTALAWSRRGFSWRFLRVLRHLKRLGAPCAIVFHDAEPNFGSRLIDRVRRTVQLYTMRNAIQLADLSILTIPPDKIPWNIGQTGKTIFIPVGANLPAPELAWLKPCESSGASPKVAVFSLSDGRVGAVEVNAIADAVLFVAERFGPVQLSVLGRNSEAAQIQLRQRLENVPVQIIVHGLLPPEEVVRVLSSCDAMLFVRGPLSTRRGSALAGIACGLPVVARHGWETASPITEAGIEFVRPEESGKFGPALLRVLSDAPLRSLLAVRSREVYTRYLSWEVIASQFAEAMAKYASNAGSNKPQ